jgi:hypothetical protein
MSSVKTTREAIVEYWCTRVYEGDIGTDWSEALNRCWRCSDEHRNLDRCHIIAAQHGGPDEPSNLVLLCGPCHAEAPMVLDRTFIWHWIRIYRMETYDTFWCNRILAEYKRLYGEDFKIPHEVVRAFSKQIEPLQSFPGHVRLEAERMAFEQTRLSAFLQEAYKAAGFHFGHCVRPVSLATSAWVMRQAVTKCSDRRGVDACARSLFGST